MIMSEMQEKESLFRFSSDQPGFSATLCSRKRLRLHGVLKLAEGNLVDKRERCDLDTSGGASRFIWRPDDDEIGDRVGAATIRHTLIAFRVPACLWRPLSLYHGSFQMGPHDGYFFFSFFLQSCTLRVAHHLIVAIARTGKFSRAQA